jgi:hypothetical protein
MKGERKLNEKKTRDYGSGDEMQERIDLFTRSGMMSWDAGHRVGRVGDRRERDRVGDDTRVLEFALDYLNLHWLVFVGTYYGSKCSAAVITTESLLSGS